MAHTLLGSVSVVIESVGRLADDWDPHDEAHQALLRKLSEHAGHIRSVLHALVRGMPLDLPVVQIEPCGTTHSCAAPPAEAIRSKSAS